MRAIFVGLLLSVLVCPSSGQSLDLQLGGVTVVSPDAYEKGLDLSLEARLGAGRQVASPHLLLSYSSHGIETETADGSASAIRIGAGMITAAAELFYVRFGGAMEHLDLDLTSGQEPEMDSPWRPSLEMAVGVGNLGSDLGGTVEVITRSRLADTPHVTFGAQLGVRLGGSLD